MNQKPTHNKNTQVYWYFLTPPINIKWFRCFYLCLYGSGAAGRSSGWSRCGCGSGLCHPAGWLKMMLLLRAGFQLRIHSGPPRSDREGRLPVWHTCNIPVYWRGVWMIHTRTFGTTRRNVSAGFWRTRLGRLLMTLVLWTSWPTLMMMRGKMSDRSENFIPTPEGL